jgi:hypothetical protein
MKGRLKGSDYACQYRAVDSPIHRLPAGWKMFISTALSIWILVVREPNPPSHGQLFAYFCPMTWPTLGDTLS